MKRGRERGAWNENPRSVCQMPKSTTLGDLPGDLLLDLCGGGRRVFLRVAGFFSSPGPALELGASLTLAAGGGGAGSAAGDGAGLTGAAGAVAATGLGTTGLGCCRSRKAAATTALTAATPPATHQRKVERLSTGANVRVSGSPVVPLL